VRDAQQAARPTNDDDRPDHDYDEGIAVLHLLGAEIAHPGFWNPTFIGIATVVSAVGLFCGSAYLLLATNLGARLGFLVALAGLSAFLVLLTTLWWTSGSSGIDPPHGSSPSWKVIEVVSRPSEAKTAAVRNIATKGTPVSEDLLTNLKPAVDAALVRPTQIAGVKTPAAPLAQFDSSVNYLVDFTGFKSFIQGGQDKNVFWHVPKYAAVEFCPARLDATGAPVVPPMCDPLQDTQYAILAYDYGTLRQPVVAFWFMAVALFAISLLGLHWYEKDERERKRAALAPVPTPGS
jgi:hypothetical protein